MLKRLSPHFFAALEAGVIGLFFVQALRFLIGMIYSRIAGGSAIAALQAAGLAPEPLPIDPTIVSTEITLTLYMLVLPMLTLLFARVRPLILTAAAAVAVGRLLMVDLGIGTPTGAAAITVGAGLVYLAYVVRWRLRMLPYFFILGFGVDQVFRAYGNTLDPSWAASYLNIQIGLSAAAIVLAVITYVLITNRERDDTNPLPADHGLLPFWGGVGMAGLLYLQLSLLALPNAIAARADVDYTTFVPFVVVATLLPLIPPVRDAARRFIGVFDPALRGWLWLLIAALLLILGARTQGIIAGAALVIAQFVVSLMWWWLARPKAAKERAVGGLWLTVGALLLALLIAGDNFTYEYAFVREFSGDFAFLNPIVLPLLRGFSGLGLGVILLALFLAALPMTQTQRRIPWLGSASALTTVVLTVFVIGAAALAAYFARPPVVRAEISNTNMRVATYNLHGGFDEFYGFDLPRVARTIQESGANVILLQEVEAGRMTSFGVDQTLWLARRLGMDRRYYPTVEGLQGLAVLSNMQIAFDDGALLTSRTSQTGVQRVQVLPNPDPTSVVTVYNTWLSPLLELSGEAPEAQEQDQQQQLRELYALFIRERCGAVVGRAVIGGTFHNVPDSPLIEQLRNAGFSDPFAGLPLELSATFVRTGLPRARFDYLWTCNLPSVGAIVLPNAGSDHRLAVAGVVLDGE